ncbi:unnamed protein product [Closterium sp. Naga37s-1]|nr:unnamed protein product [Closterium sp. Naga37s-1]
MLRSPLQPPVLSKAPFCTPTYPSRDGAKQQHLLSSSLLLQGRTPKNAVCCALPYSPLFSPKPPSVLPPTLPEMAQSSSTFFPPPSSSKGVPPRTRYAALSLTAPCSLQSPLLYSHLPFPRWRKAAAPSFLLPPPPRAYPQERGMLRSPLQPPVLSKAPFCTPTYPSRDGAKQQHLLSSSLLLQGRTPKNAVCCALPYSPLFSPKPPSVLPPTLPEMAQSSSTFFPPPSSSKGMAQSSSTFFPPPSSSKGVPPRTRYAALSLTAPCSLQSPLLYSHLPFPRWRKAAAPSFLLPPPPRAYPQERGMLRSPLQPPVLSKAPFCTPTYPSRDGAKQQHLLSSSLLLQGRTPKNAVCCALPYSPLFSPKPPSVLPPTLPEMAQSSSTFFPPPSSSKGVPPRTRYAALSLTAPCSLQSPLLYSHLPFPRWRKAAAPSFLLPPPPRAYPQERGMLRSPLQPPVLSKAPFCTPTYPSRDGAKQQHLLSSSLLLQGRTPKNAVCCALPYSPLFSPKPPSVLPPTLPEMAQSSSTFFPPPSSSKGVPPRTRYAALSLTAPCSLQSPLLYSHLPFPRWRKAAAPSFLLPPPPRAYPQERGMLRSPLQPPVLSKAPFCTPTYPSRDGAKQQHLLSSSLLLQGRTPKNAVCCALPYSPLFSPKPPSVLPPTLPEMAQSSSTFFPPPSSSKGVPPRTRYAALSLTAPCSLQSPLLYSHLPFPRWRKAAAPSFLLPPPPRAYPQERGMLRSPLQPPVLSKAPFCTPTYPSRDGAKQQHLLSSSLLLQGRTPKNAVCCALPYSPLFSPKPPSVLPPTLPEMAQSSSTFFPPPSSSKGVPPRTRYGALSLTAPCSLQSPLLYSHLPFPRWRKAAAPSFLLPPPPRAYPQERGMVRSPLQPPVLSKAPFCTPTYPSRDGAKQQHLLSSSLLLQGRTPKNAVCCALPYSPLFSPKPPSVLPPTLPEMAQSSSTFFPPPSSSKGVPPRTRYAALSLTAPCSLQSPLLYSHLPFPRWRKAAAPSFLLPPPPRAYPQERGMLRSPLQPPVLSKAPFCTPTYPSRDGAKQQHLLSSSLLLQGRTPKNAVCCALPYSPLFSPKPPSVLPPTLPEMAQSSSTFFPPPSSSKGVPPRTRYAALSLTAPCSLQSPLLYSHLPFPRWRKAAAPSFLLPPPPRAYPQERGMLRSPLQPPVLSKAPFCTPTYPSRDGAKQQHLLSSSLLLQGRTPKNAVCCALPYSPLFSPKPPSVLPPTLPEMAQSSSTFFPPPSSSKGVPPRTRYAALSLTAPCSLQSPLLYSHLPFPRWRKAAAPSFLLPPPPRAYPQERGMLRSPLQPPVLSKAPFCTPTYPSRDGAKQQHLLSSSLLLQGRTPKNAVCCALPYSPLFSPKPPSVLPPTLPEMAQSSSTFFPPPSSSKGVPPRTRYAALSLTAPCSLQSPLLYSHLPFPRWRKAAAPSFLLPPPPRAYPQERGMLRSPLQPPVLSKAPFCTPTYPSRDGAKQQHLLSSSLLLQGRTPKNAVCCALPYSPLFSPKPPSVLPPTLPEMAQSSSTFFPPPSSSKGVPPRTRAVDFPHQSYFSLLFSPLFSPFPI